MKNRPSKRLVENLHVPSSWLNHSSESHGGLHDDETRMMDQFFDLKEQHPDTVLFFRMVIFTNSSTTTQRQRSSAFCR